MIYHVIITQSLEHALAACKSSLDAQPIAHVPGEPHRLVVPKMFYMINLFQTLTKQYLNFAQMSITYSLLQNTTSPMMIILCDIMT